MRQMKKSRKYFIDLKPADNTPHRKASKAFLLKINSNIVNLKICKRLTRNKTLGEFSFYAVLCF